MTRKSFLIIITVLFFKAQKENFSVKSRSRPILPGADPIWPESAPGPRTSEPLEKVAAPQHCTYVGSYIHLVGGLLLAGQLSEEEEDLLLVLPLQPHHLVLVAQPHPAPRQTERSKIYHGPHPHITSLDPDPDSGTNQKINNKFRTVFCY